MERETNNRGIIPDSGEFEIPAPDEYLTRQELEDLLAEGDEQTEFLDFGLANSAEAGSANVQMLPLHWTIELTQIRQDYDPVKLQELNDRMFESIEDGVVRIGLVNPPTINKLDSDHIGSFLDDYNNYHHRQQKPISPEDLTSVDGFYYITVNGMRRRRTLMQKQHRFDISPDAFLVALTIKENLSFEQSKKEQYVENTSDPINPVHDAEAIELHYLWLKSRQRDHSVAALQDVFGYSADKIRDALRYVVAPDVVKKFVGRGLTYTNAVDLVRLRESYATLIKCRAVYNNSLDDLDTVHSDSERRLIDYFESRIVSRLKNKPSAHIARSIKAKIKEVKADATFSNDELFEFDVELERNRRKKQIRGDMAVLAIETLRYLYEQQALSSDDLQSLHEILSTSDTAQSVVNSGDEAVSESELESLLFSDNLQN